jgi:serine/threonine protein kinase
VNKEIEALRSLKHKNIVKMFYSFPLPLKQEIIVVMEYMEGGELTDFWHA